MFSLARTRMTRAISQCGSVRRFAQMQEVKPTLKAFQRDTENEAATEFHRAGKNLFKYAPGDKGGTVKTVAMETTVGECCTFMKRSNIGAVIVMKEGHMAGIFTDRDAVKFVATGSQREQPVQKYMTSAEALYVATAKTSVNDMMRMVLDYNIRHKRDKLVLEGSTKNIKSSFVMFDIIYLTICKYISDHICPRWSRKRVKEKYTHS